MALDLAQPKDIDTKLIAYVEAGNWRVHVLDYRRWERLPLRLKNKYYPMFRRHTTPYRMYPKYMKARRDEDITTKISSRRQALKKIVRLPVQSTGDKVAALPLSPVVSTDPSTKDTDLESKSYAQIAREARILAKRPATVTTRYSRY